MHCRFLWRQLWNALGVAKVDMIYGAMFDEVSEGTAYYKIAKDKKDTPANAELICTYIRSSQIIHAQKRPLPRPWRASVRHTVSTSELMIREVQYC